ncbi:MAG: prepilin-type N-terminal cleavage/methylation domain-containing protein [Oscillospiraceae bacterium]|nr:prepilin-type N-terminal cleavage/methylation domain-containing protein [Oscillospiraceae bacterium]
MKKRIEFRGQSGFSLLEFIIAIAIMALIISVTIPAFVSARQRMMEIERSATEDAINKALRQCYALEGKYPPVTGETGLDYLSENYGIILKPDVFVYEYKVIEGMPRFSVRIRAEGADSP